MRASPRIVAAEDVAEMTVAGDVVSLDADPAILQCRCDVAAEKSRGPATMIGFEQQVAVAGALRKSDEFAGPGSRQCGLAAEISIDPQTPFGLVSGCMIAQRCANHVGAPIIFLDLGALYAAHDHQR